MNAPIKPVRVGRVTDPDGQGPFEHYCWCGAWGTYGYGVKLRDGIPGEWFCADHRPDPPSQKPAQSAAPADAELDQELEAHCRMSFASWDPPRDVNGNARWPAMPELEKEYWREKFRPVIEARRKTAKQAVEVGASCELRGCPHQKGSGRAADAMSCESSLSIMKERTL
jgi:hypothetical protein